MSAVKLFFLFTLLSSNLCECKKYNNFTLYRGMPVNVDHVQFFKNLSEYFEVNFWRPPSTVYRPVEFVMPPKEKEQFLAEVQRQGIYLTTIIPDLQRAFDKQTVKSYIRRKMESYDWESFYRLKDIYSWLNDVSLMFPEDMKLFSIGKTYENRNIMAAKIALNGTKKRSTVIVEGGIHAREWIGPAFVTYLIMQILHSKNSQNKELKNIAMTYEWYFVPVLNPDGYEYSHKEDRLWRKNREQGHGVDINRNFGYGFGTTGVSRKKYSDIYCGPSAFSERESRAMATLVEARNKTLEYYLGFHSYGQYMIIPYAHSTAHRENFYEVKRMGMQAANSLALRYGTRYTVGTAYDTVGYKTSGVSGCWVKKKFKVPYVLTFELRDNGEEGFALPTSQILPTCRETLDAVLSILQPRTKNFQKLKFDPSSSQQQHDSQDNIMLDKVVIVCNVLVFIIVHFD